MRHSEKRPLCAELPLRRKLPLLNYCYLSGTFKQAKTSQHTADVTIILSYKTFGFFLTSAADQTIRLWNSVNRILRIIELPASPVSAAFLGHTADLAFTSRDDLWLLPAKNYLPKTMLCEHELIKHDSLLGLSSQKTVDGSSVARNINISAKDALKGKDTLFILDKMTERERARNNHLKLREQEISPGANQPMKTDGESKTDAPVAPLESLAPDYGKLEKMDAFCSKMAAGLSKIKNQRQNILSQMVNQRN